MFAPFQMRLKDQADHMVVAQRVDDIAKHGLARLECLVFRQRGDRVIDALIGPAVIAGQHTKSAFAHFTKSP
jgi:hypothetical protein